LQTPGTGRREAGGIRRAVFGGRRAACGRWQAAYVGRNHDVGRYHSLNLIFSTATMTRSHESLKVIVSTIAALDSAGKVDNWISGRAVL
jgi:hypothetical protein